MLNTESPDDYDSPWKEAVEHYFPEFMAFYFPEANQQINWTAGFEFLEQELRAITQDAELGKRYVDKLAKVTLLNGDDKWIYIHIEVQGSRETNFAERIFIYNYRIYDKYRRPVASMAVLADEQDNWRPNSFSFATLGCEHSLTFPIAKLTDFQENLQTLLASANPFAIITAAHILTKQTRKDSQARFNEKSKLVRLLYQKNWEKQQIIDLLWVLDWLMRLPEALERQLQNEIAVIEETAKMRYVTSWERLAKEDGRQQGLEQGLEKGLEQGLEKGLEQGLEKGLEQGRKQEAAKLFLLLLESKFGEIRPDMHTKIQLASPEQIEHWTKQIFQAESPESLLDS